MRSERKSATAVIVSKNNGYGLTIDANILAETLTEIGVSATIAEPGKRGWSARFFGRPAFEFVFHLERVYPSWTRAGDRNILIPNQERFPRRHIARLGKIDLVLAKTIHAREIFTDLGCTTVHVGFESRDLYDPAAQKDWRKFLHVAGGSTLKGTEDILALWKKHPEWPTLVLVQKQANLATPLPPNVEAASSFLSDEEMLALMNRCGIHLCPSRAEGWGHYIHEALGCGAVVLTTDAPPMNEFVTEDYGLLVDADRHVPRHLGISSFVNPGSIQAAISSTLSANEEELAAKGRLARQKFLGNNAAFRDRLREALG